MSTITGVWSLAAPEKDGALLPDGDGGASSVTVGADVSIVNVTGALLPGTLPMPLGCVAMAVKVPSPSAGRAAAEVQRSPAGVALALATGVPSGTDPANTSTETGVASVDVPENEGVVSLLTAGGGVSVTVGGSVSTTNVTGALSPTASAPSFRCNATAVKVCWPPGSAGAAGPELQLPWAAGAVAIAARGPSGRVPSNTSTLTAVASLAVPENAGTVSLERAGGGLKLTAGERALTSKLTGLLIPATLSSEPICVATAVYLPPASGAVTRPDAQLSSLTSAGSSTIGRPSAAGPRYTLTVTGVVSLAVPLNDGLASLEISGSGLSVTVGAGSSAPNAYAAISAGPGPPTGSFEASSPAALGGGAARSASANSRTSHTVRLLGA